MTQVATADAAATPQRTSPVRVRKLGHVVYRVSDIERSIKFYTEILNFRVSDTNELGMVFLNACGDHHTIALVPAKAGAAATQADPSGLGLHHFAMEVATLDELFEIRDFLRDRGVPITFEGRRGAGCNTGVEFLDPDGYSIELYCGMDQIGANNRARPASQWRRASSLEEARDNPVPTLY